MKLDPADYTCPDHHTDLTGQVLDALDEDGPPVAYPRLPLLGRKAGPAAVRGAGDLPRRRERRPAPADLRRDLDPVTGPVRPPSRADQVWADLAAELAPAKSLARIDTVTARAVTTITVVGVLLTGLGAASTALPAQPGPARALAAATVITAALAVAAALTAQVLTITRHLNPANLTDVKAWYRRQFQLRAYPTQAATILLLARRPARRRHRGHRPAHQPASTPTLTVTQTLRPAYPAAAQQATVTVSVTFRDLAPGQVATVILTTPGPPVLARAVATAAADGTATITLTAGHLTAGQPVTITARSPRQACQATLPRRPASPPSPATPAEPTSPPRLGPARMRNGLRPTPPPLGTLPVICWPSAIATAARPPDTSSAQLAPMIPRPRP